MPQDEETLDTILSAYAVGIASFLAVRDVASLDIEPFCLPAYPAKPRRLWPASRATRKLTLHSSRHQIKRLDPLPPRFIERQSSDRSAAPKLLEGIAELSNVTAAGDRAVYETGSARQGAKSIRNIRDR